ncbi:MAG: hypothetical protein MMC33_005152 [Icmadophila ericetorum]|nr:hypothetical protein [Icmadophila ericetorum]
MDPRTAVSPGYQAPSPQFCDWVLYPAQQDKDFAQPRYNVTIESPPKPLKLKPESPLLQRRKFRQCKERKVPCVSTSSCRQVLPAKADEHPSNVLVNEFSIPKFTPPAPRPTRLPSPDLEDFEELDFWGTSTELQADSAN